MSGSTGKGGGTLSPSTQVLLINFFLIDGQQLLKYELTVLLMFKLKEPLFY
jgi:hypothetical protein